MVGVVIGLVIVFFVAVGALVLLNEISQEIGEGLNEGFAFDKELWVQAGKFIGLLILGALCVLICSQLALIS